MNSQQLTPHSFIANTDPADQPGSQWTAFYCPAEAPLEIFQLWSSTYSFSVLFGMEWLQSLYSKQTPTAKYREFSMWSVLPVLPSSAMSRNGHDQLHLPF